ncbi:MAG TPA: bifunctional adenosylcobinamide kinase/adenosylcobinamide-phosphate guanylyltransferase [Microlunatus sp.]|nr:bifunctional adenosylcobinamide kinase/adenosylcobinamide-phosphate guanylyltransferase [Microlunatus sp.]
MSRRILITGGVRSGKSAYAERLLAARSDVTYLATGPVPDPAADPEWAARIAAHQSRRSPLGWTTIETADPARVLRSADGPVLLDCLGTWLTACLDELEAWQRPVPNWRPAWEDRAAAFVRSWRDRECDVVGVTNEVGWGVVPEHASGRLFADLLGRLNQQVAAASDEVVLMVMGRPIAL